MDSDKEQLCTELVQEHTVIIGDPGKHEMNDDVDNPLTKFYLYFRRQPKQHMSTAGLAKSKYGLYLMSGVRACRK